MSVNPQVINDRWHGAGGLKPGTRLAILAGGF